MKITVIGHASILIQTRGLTILSDPWWRGPCFGAQWWNYPPPDVQSVEDRSIDYIYVSHGHHDHLHPGTLRTLNKRAKVLVSSQVDIAKTIRGLGMEVIEIRDDESVDLGQGVRCRIIPTHGDDTLMAIDDGTEVCINLNDALHSAPAPVQREFVARLRAIYPRIDYVFCGYGVASHFPNCYRIPGKNREETAVHRQRYFNRSWAKLIAELEPRFGFPFAADVVFLEDDLFWVNEPTHNSERPTEAFAAQYPRSTVRALDVGPGFEIESGSVVRNVLRQPIRSDALRATCGESIERANRLGRVLESDVREVLGLMTENLKLCKQYLLGRDGDYRFLIAFRNTSFGIEIHKAHGSIALSIVSDERGHGVTYDIIYRTRLPYLRWSFTEPYGDEILFVGSGGIFEYADQLQARRNLHRELKVLLTKQPGPLPPRRTETLLGRLKRAAKRALGRQNEDFYDLARWTVFSE